MEIMRRYGLLAAIGLLCLCAAQDQLQNPTELDGTAEEGVEP